MRKITCFYASRFPSGRTRSFFPIHIASVHNWQRSLNYVRCWKELATQQWRAHLHMFRRARLEEAKEVPCNGSSDGCVLG